jgi:hypothetical protein
MRLPSTAAALSAAGQRDQPLGRAGREDLGGGWGALLRLEAASTPTTGATASEPPV